MKIPFNKPYLTGKEIDYLKQAIISDNAEATLFIDQCKKVLKGRYGFDYLEFLNSTKDAFILAAKVLNLTRGDEVIMASFTNPIIASAFIDCGVEVKFADSSNESPNMEYDTIRPHVSDKTKAIVVNNYGGSASSMAPIMRLAKEHNIKVIEDCTEAFDAKHRGSFIGKVGAVSVYGFNQQTNLSSMECAVVATNEKDLGKTMHDLLTENDIYKSVFTQPQELTMAYLFLHLKSVEEIQRNRLNEWINYFNELEEIKKKDLVNLPKLSFEDRPNGQIFYLVCNDSTVRQELMTFLRARDIDARPHYSALHKTQGYIDKYGEVSLPNAEKYSEGLLVLPMYNTLSEAERQHVTKAIKDYFKVK